MATKKTSTRKAAPTVAILMGSSNDWDVMQHGARQLKDFGVSLRSARVVRASHTRNCWRSMSNNASRAEPSASSPAPAAPRTWRA